MVDIKNIIIIGKVGSGKSALANVLSGTEVFKEDSSSLTEIWRAKDKEFEVNLQEENDKKTRYRVIDTIGLGGATETEQEKKELLEKFEEEVGAYIDKGISQVFLVMEGKVDKGTLTEFFWLNEFLFDNKALDYTTIVRTKFTDFRSKKKRQEDAEGLTAFFNENSKEEYKEIVDKVLLKKKVVHVDNLTSDEDLRQKSRKKLLEHLSKLNNEEPHKSETRRWLDKDYPFEYERKKLTVLDMSKRNLKGRLSLKGFTNLERLNCSNNQLTSLDLSDCPNLIELKCNNNQLTNLNFLKSVSNLEKLEIQDNKNLSSQSLRILENLNKLEELNINNTNLSEGWECLLKNCQKLYCNSEEIMKELDKKDCSNNDQDGKKYYNLDHWRKTDQQSNLTAKVIPLERLYVIRSNIKKFINKWGKEVEDNWYENTKKRLFNLSKNQSSTENKVNELEKLQDPKQFHTHWWVAAGIQWTNRTVSVVGGSLILVGAGDENSPYTKTGGVIAITSPFIEIVTSQINAKIYEARERKWDEFVEDTKELLDNYHELLGIVEKITIGKLGEVNKKLKNLSAKVKVFLKEYDKEDESGKKNGVIDINELTNLEARKKFAENLGKEDKEKGGGSQLGDIVKAIINLEKELINYHQNSSLMEVDSEEILENQTVNLSTEETKINIDETQEKDSIHSQIQISPKGSS
jgi:AIG1 family/Leucine Rich repeats (2 copies)